MKKLLFVIVISVLVLTACSGNDRNNSHPNVDMRFRSVLDTETGELLALGDSSRRIRRVLGEPRTVIESQAWTSYHFYDVNDINRTIMFQFMTAHPSVGATWILVEDTERFEFQVTLAEVRQDFDPSFGAYWIGYNSEGIRVDIDSDEFRYFIIIDFDARNEEIRNIQRMFWSSPGSD
jgi:hypothetical protein